LLKSICDSCEELMHRKARLWYPQGGAIKTPQPGHCCILCSQSIVPGAQAPSYAFSSSVRLLSLPDIMCMLCVPPFTRSVFCHMVDLLVSIILLIESSNQMPWSTGPP
jgi:hypothetical protein